MLATLFTVGLTKRIALILQNQGEKGFNSMIFSCVERALKSLGDDVAISFFYQIEKKFCLPREELVSRPLELIHCLEQLLGVAGSRIIEKKIVHEIEIDFDLSSTTSLERAITSAKRKFLTR